MKILVTSARMPFALAIIRRLARSGHEVHASDTYSTAPGSHSRYVTGHLVTSAPKFSTERFVHEVADYTREHGIDLVVPAWEDVFYLACHREIVESGGATLYAGTFEALARLHDKHSFEVMVEQLGIRAPVGVTVHATSSCTRPSAAGRTTSAAACSRAAA